MVGSRGTLARNTASLYVMHFANYMVPLVMIPYLVRVLGPAGFGAVSFAQGLINYIVLFTEYGFDWSATRKIAVYRQDSESVSHIALHVWVAKTFLCMASLGLLVLIVFLVPRLYEVRFLLIALYGLVLGNVLFPTWLFQGMERMTVIALINLAMKVGVLISVLTLVHAPQDSALYAGLTGGGAVVAGLTGLLVAVRTFRLKRTALSSTDVAAVLREGRLLFLSKASVSLYTAGNAFILGMLTNHSVVGYYSAAERMVRGLQGLFGPIAQAVYPRFIKLAAESREKTVAWAGRLLAAMGGMGLLLSLVVLLGAPLISEVMLGPAFAPSIPVIRLMAPIIFFVALSNVLGVQVMVPLRKDRAFTLVIFAAGLLNIALASVLAPTFGALGMAAAVVASELFVTVAMFIYLRSIGVRFLTLSVWQKA
jgi:PST family polysaccharide transporter